jgi:2-oxo-3-(phosphooxy)propyl 3-oxoalkanoate synthase
MTATIITEPEGGRLSFERTVDRTLLHRRALSEVFLTDTASTGEACYAAAAQLPSSHAYFTDHAGHTALDPILLLECARQAETYGAHVHLDVGRDTKFILRSWSMRLPGLFTTHIGEAAELTMAVTTDRLSGARVPPRSLTYDIAMSLAGAPIGDVRIDVAYLSSPAYIAMRTLRRDGRVVSSDELRATQSNVLPAAVGRSRPVNVVLVDPVRARNGFSAAIRLPVDNRSMFDHPQDHLPGIVLTEAGRQLCLLAGAELHGLLATNATVVGFDLRFTRFAELDAPTAVLATAERADFAGTHTFALSFHQKGEVVADGTMTTRAVPETHRVDR